MTADENAIPDDSLLAWHEGALTPTERQALAARLAGDAAAQATLADWARQDAALQALYGPRGDEPVPARLTRTLKTKDLNGLNIKPGAFIRNTFRQQVWPWLQ